MEIKLNNRGFAVGVFIDTYGSKCSVQQSSLASDDRLWVGVDDPNPQILASQAADLGIDSPENTGWIPYPLPSQVLLSTRMHLDEQQVKELVGVLQRWLDTGTLTKENDDVNTNL